MTCKDFRSQAFTDPELRTVAENAAWFGHARLCAKCDQWFDKRYMVCSIKMGMERVTAEIRASLPVAKKLAAKLLSDPESGWAERKS